MARKRTTKSTTTTETPIPTPSEPDPQPAEPVSLAVLEASRSEVSQEQPSFVDRVQQQRGRTVTTDPFGIAGDYEAGVRLFENRRFRQMAIKFEEKPTQDVLDLVKSAGYRWNSRDMM